MILMERMRLRLASPMSKSLVEPAKSSFEASIAYSRQYDKSRTNKCLRQTRAVLVRRWTHEASRAPEGFDGCALRVWQLLGE